MDNTTNDSWFTNSIKEQDSYYYKYLHVYQRVDQYKFSRSKIAINRDFSDAVLFAELIKYDFPSLIHINNYPTVNSINNKINNWQLLNDKVLKKLKMPLNKDLIIKLSNSVIGAIEEVLIQYFDIVDSGFKFQNINKKYNNSNNNKHLSDYNKTIINLELQIDNLINSINYYKFMISNKQKENEILKNDIKILKTHQPDK